MFFIFCITAFIINQLLQFIGIYNTFTSSYLDDLLFFPITFSIIVYVIKKKRNQINYKMPLAHIILSIIIVSLIFEVLAPLFLDYIYADYNAIVFYCLGSYCFYIYQSKLLFKKFSISNKTNGFLNIYLMSFMSYPIS